MIRSHQSIEIQESKEFFTIPRRQGVGIRNTPVLDLFSIDKDRRLVDEVIWLDVTGDFDVKLLRNNMRRKRLTTGRFTETAAGMPVRDPSSRF